MAKKKIRTARVSFTCEPSTKQKAEAKAAKKNQSLSRYVESLILEDVSTI